MPQQSTVKGVVISQDAPNTKLAPMQLALFDPQGAPLTLLQPAEAQANSTASDVAGVVSDFNSLLAKLRAAGHIAS